jgi:hypothetical protein
MAVEECIYRLVHLQFLGQVVLAIEHDLCAWCGLSELGRRRRPNSQALECRTDRHPIKADQGPRKRAGNH